MHARRYDGAGEAVATRRRQRRRHDGGSRRLLDRREPVGRSVRSRRPRGAVGCGASSPQLGPGGAIRHRPGRVPASACRRGRRASPPDRPRPPEHARLQPHRLQPHRRGAGRDRGRHLPGPGPDARATAPCGAAVAPGRRRGAAVAPAGGRYGRSARCRRPGARCGRSAHRAAGRGRPPPRAASGRTPGGARLRNRGPQRAQRPAAGHPAAGRPHGGAGSRTPLTIGRTAAALGVRERVRCPACRSPSPSTAAACACTSVAAAAGGADRRNAAARGSVAGACRGPAIGLRRIRPATAGAGLGCSPGA